MSLGIPFVTALLGRRFADRTAQALSALITVALIGGLLWLAYLWAWDRGRDHQRDIDRQRIVDLIKARDAAMAQAGAADAAVATAVEDEITRNRKDLDDATASLPDHGLTDRQRARACRELVQQGLRCPPSAPAAANAGN